MNYYCSRCGAALDRNTTICQNCGKVLDQGGDRPRYYCGDCGSVVGEVQNTCFKCGKRLGRPMQDLTFQRCIICSKRVKKLFPGDVCLTCSTKRRGKHYD